MPLKDQVVWITGASSGIGAALAIECARQGARVVLSARNAEALERVRAQCGERALALPLDMTRFDELPARAREVLAACGQIDWLVLNAGISQRGKVIDTALKVDEELLRTNFLGPVALTKAVLPSMVQRRTGTIAVVSSLVGKFGTPLRSSYAASKHALHGFFDSLRAEVWDDGVRVSIVCPGYVRTEVSRNALRADGTKYGEMDPGTDAGMAPDVFAKRMIAAVESGQEEIYIGGRELRGVWLKRFAPGVFSRFIRKAKVT